MNEDPFRSVAQLGWFLLALWTLIIVTLWAAL